MKTRKVHLWEVRGGELLPPEWKHKNGGRLRIRAVQLIPNGARIVDFDDGTASAPVSSSAVVEIEETTEED